MSDRATCQPWTRDDTSCEDWSFQALAFSCLGLPDPPSSLALSCPSAGLHPKQARCQLSPPEGGVGFSLPLPYPATGQGAFYRGLAVNLRRQGVGGGGRKWAPALLGIVFPLPQHICLQSPPRPYAPSSFPLACGTH